MVDFFHFILWAVLGTVVGGVVGLLVYLLFLFWPDLPDSQRSAIIPCFGVLGFLVGEYGFFTSK